MALLAWAGPIWDVLTNSPHNVSKLIANFSEPSEDPIGIGRGLEAVLQSADPFGPWVWGGSEVAGSALPGLALLLAWLVVAGVVAWKRENLSLTRLNAVLLGVSLMGALAVSRVFGALYLYTFRWIVAIVAMQVFTLGWGLVVLLGRPSPVWQRRFAGVAVGLEGFVDLIEGGFDDVVFGVAGPCGIGFAGESPAGPGSGATLLAAGGFQAIRVVLEMHARITDEDIRGRVAHKPDHRSIGERKFGERCFITS